MHIKCTYDALELKRFYIKMYREVYLRKSCLIGQRIIEKEIYHLIRSGKISEASLWGLMDEELTALICKSARGRKGYDRYQRLGSKCVIAFKLDGFGWTENTSEKPITVVEKNQQFFDFLSSPANSSPAILDAKENELAARGGGNSCLFKGKPSMASSEI